MIEKLVALIREKHKDSNSLVLADMLEEHGEKIANEIVGAAMCHLFALNSLPKYALFMGANVIHDGGFDVRPSIQMVFTELVDADFMKRIFEATSRVVYGEGPSMQFFDQQTGEITNQPLYKDA